MDKPAMEARVEQELDVTHKWMGCEEVNDWFVATCSCGWTYQHPNYGSSQDTFVNHWGDHILATLRADGTKAAEELARVRDELAELKREHWLNTPHNSPEECVSFYDGCHCTVEALEHNIERAEGYKRELARERKRHQRTREVLGDFYDKWENGISCQESDEDGIIEGGGSLGNAVKLSFEEEQVILNIIVDKAESYEQACANCGKPYRAHLLHLQNKCSPNEDAAWFPKSIADALEPKAEPAPAPAAQPPLWSGFEMLDSIRASLAQAAELGTLESVGGDIEVMNSVQILMDKAAKRGAE